MNREKALNLIKNNVKNKNSVKHMLAVEAIMRALADHFGEDKEKWGIAGLLHDIDMEIVDSENEPGKHGVVGAEILRKEGVEEEIIDAVMAHNEDTGKERKALMEKAIYAVDPLTGLIVASTLVVPSRKIGDLTEESVQKRFKEKSFARGARRDAISSCEEFGMELDDFIKVGLSAMREIAEDLEL